MGGEGEVELGYLVFPQELGLDVDFPEHGEVEYSSLGVTNTTTVAVVAGNHRDVGVWLAEVGWISDKDPECFNPPCRRELLHQHRVSVKLGRLKVVGLYVYWTQRGRDSWKHQQRQQDDGDVHLPTSRNKEVCDMGEVAHAESRGRRVFDRFCEDGTFNSSHH